MALRDCGLFTFGGNEAVNQAENQAEKREKMVKKTKKAARKSARLYLNGITQDAAGTEVNAKKHAYPETG